MSRRFENGIGDDFFIDLYGILFFRRDERYSKQMAKVKPIKGDKNDSKTTV
tara:strand:- start:350 stop:502 length:153 start_codon:yes stop_codon:yes gene_type:complete